MNCLLLSATIIVIITIWWGRADSSAAQQRAARLKPQGFIHNIIKTFKRSSFIDLSSDFKHFIRLFSNSLITLKKFKKCDICQKNSNE